VSPRATDSPPDALQRATALQSWLFLLGFLFLLGAARGVYSANGANTSARFELLAYVGFLTFVWYWLRKQCEPYRVSFPMDLGWFMSLWVVLAPYYLWRALRWKGLVRFIVVLGAWGLSYGVSLVVHYGLVALD